MDITTRKSCRQGERLRENKKISDGDVYQRNGRKRRRKLEKIKTRCVVYTKTKSACNAYSVLPPSLCVVVNYSWLVCGLGNTCLQRETNFQPAASTGVAREIGLREWSPEFLRPAASSEDFVYSTSRARLRSGDRFQGEMGFRDVVGSLSRA